MNPRRAGYEPAAYGARSKASELYQAELRAPVASGSADNCRCNRDINVTKVGAWLTGLDAASVCPVPCLACGAGHTQ